jgi:hypothetical protein
LAAAAATWARSSEEKKISILGFWVCGILEMSLLSVSLQARAVKKNEENEWRKMTILFT